MVQPTQPPPYGILMDLTGFGSGAGLVVWSLVPEINELDPTIAGNLITSAQRFLMSYGGWDNSKPNFGALAAELVYNVAESLFFWKQNARAFNSPFRMEQIGSYRYQKFEQQKNPRDVFVDMLLDHPFIGPLVTYLRDRRAPFTRNTRVFQDVAYNDTTGIRDIVLKNYSNRVERAIALWNIVGDTAQFNYLVYGDSLIVW